MDSPVRGITLRRLRSPKAILKKGGPMPLQSSSKLGTTCSTAPPSHQFLCPEALGRHMTLAMMKDKRQYTFFNKLPCTFNNFRHLLANSINQLCNLRKFTLVFLLYYVIYLYFCHLYIFFTFYCKIVKKSKTISPKIGPSRCARFAFVFVILCYTL